MNEKRSKITDPLDLVHRSLVSSRAAASLDLVHRSLVSSRAAASLDLVHRSLVSSRAAASLDLVHRSLVSSRAAASLDLVHRSLVSSRAAASLDLVHRSLVSSRAAASLDLVHRSLVSSRAAASLDLVHRSLVSSRAAASLDLVHRSLVSSRAAASLDLVHRSLVSSRAAASLDLVHRSLVSSIPGNSPARSRLGTPVSTILGGMRRSSPGTIGVSAFRHRRPYYGSSLILPQDEDVAAPEESTTLAKTENWLAQFDAIVKNAGLRKYCRGLFADGHYSLAVQRACTYVHNVVRDRSGRIDKDGADLMMAVFTPNDPVLRLNGLQTKSDRNEQQGYMFIFAGTMTGIRNPRAHEHDHEDSPEEALEMLGLTNHLMWMLNRPGS